MIASPVRRLAAASHRASLAPAASRFARALREPAAAQEARLRAILAETRESERGRELGLGAVRSLRDFRARVPVVRHGDLEPWLRRVAAGEPQVLASSPVRFLQRTGGTSGEPKLLPATGPFLDELAAATGPWIAGMQRGHPGARRGRSYWSISPAGSGARRSAGGLPIGSPDDTEYFGPVARRLLRSLMAVPPEVAGLEDAEAWRRATLAHLAACEDLSFVSVWSPSFLVALLEHADARSRELVAALRPAHALRVERRLAQGMPVGLALWPRLALVSCWTDASASTFGRLEDLRAQLPGVPIEGKGLLASEGVVSIPWPGAGAPVLAVGSHFLEFRDVEGGDDLLLAHELVPGRRYGVVLSTSAGLLRYDLGDVVECVGRHAATPTVRFVGRAGNVSDLAGEKLDGARVELLLAACESELALRPSFRLLAPALGRPPRYRLYVEGLRPGQCDALAGLLEQRLLEDPGYAHCRAMGQLGAVEAAAVEGGRGRFEDARRRQGALLGDVKPVAFDRRMGWDEHLVDAR